MNEHIIDEQRGRDVQGCFWATQWCADTVAFYFRQEQDAERFNSEANGLGVVQTTPGTRPIWRVRVMQ